MIAEPLIVSVMRVPDTVRTLGLPEWDLLIRQARQGNLLARLESLLQDNALISLVPTQPQQHLRWAAIVGERHAQAIRAEVAHIRKALAGLPFVLLKGAAYTMAALPHARGRLYSDVDILVAQASIADVESRLMVHGWMGTHHDAYDQRYYRQWMHEIPPLQHMRRQSVIDVHHAILPLTMRVHPDSDKLRQAAVALQKEPELLVLAPVDMLLHSAAHLFYEGELTHGLRDLMDLDALFRHNAAEPAFWSTLVNRARELELTRCLFYALRYAEMVLATPVPEQVLADAEIGRPSRQVLHVMDAIYRRVLLPEHFSCVDRYTGSARKALYIRANWLRMPPVLLARHLFHKAFISKKDE